MPVCIRCDVAYLPGEHHACEVKQTGRRLFAVCAAAASTVGVVLLLWSSAVQAHAAGRVWLPFLTAVFVVPLGALFLGLGLIGLLLFRANRVRDRL